MTNSHNDEKLAEVLHEFGLEGYGFWWLLLEVLGKEMDASGRCELSYPLATWARKLHCSKRKTSTFFQKFSEISLVFLDFSKENEKSCIGKLKISVPNILKYRDEYSKKSGQTPDKLPKVSGAKIEIQKQKQNKEEPLLSVSQVSDLYRKYAGVNVVNGGQVVVFQDFIKRFTPETIEEAFAAAASANISTAAFLNWCKTRMERAGEAKAAPAVAASTAREEEIAYLKAQGLV